ncbi:hypothetical protein Tco_0626252 [Tanacetum coccineum]|uniref:Uncharacterized protein n=1 Tax=Tanacetum coccineum TaxID=301880 RepID=A0ABQ4WJ29_9ASTR
MLGNMARYALTMAITESSESDTLIQDQMVKPYDSAFSSPYTPTWSLQHAVPRQQEFSGKLRKKHYPSRDRTLNI